MMIVSELHSQDSDSKMWVLRQDALKVLAAAKESALLKQKLQAKQADIDTLQARIDIREQIIVGLKYTVKLDSLMMANYDRQIAEMNSQRSLFELDISSYKSKLKKEKRKRRWTSFAGILSTAGAFMLGLKF
jgi:septal ring factor EnvC (AmiA/AmiB activator)